jgi:hypothetical protein
MGRNATPFLAKSAGTNGLGGCPDLRRFADHSGGTVADFHGLPRFPCVLNVGGSLCREIAGVNLTRCMSLQSGDSGKKKHALSVPKTTGRRGEFSFQTSVLSRKYSANIERAGFEI